MGEALFAGDLSVELEGLGSDVFHHGKMLGTRAQILAKGQDADSGLAEIVHGLEEFVLLLPETEH